MSRESLFDGRYRYDLIYPRGRSGEALRAYDTQHDDRLVVIKRPAPQDAPPIRAGQEVNIRTERRVLMQLRGHPVLTNLLDEGTFRVGGQPHLYIVMERATGLILDDLVRELAERGERLPELEMLVILDLLLDLLEAAHEHEIVYNDVDAKHLFWDRETYQLKVIDWGNAVFLEGDEVTPQGVSRQSDIYQVGELLYFIVTGGQRLVLNGSSPDFGDDDGHISTRLKSIIQRAVHSDPAHRYRNISALRRDLAEYRRPLERDRDAALERLERRLKKRHTQTQLEHMLEDVKKIQARDPGHPRTRALRQHIEDELHRLAVLADLDAARIYLENANWSRAAALLEDVAARATGEDHARALILLEASQMLLERDLRPPPAGIAPAINALFKGNAARAAHVLLTMPEAREEALTLQWLLAARIQTWVPEVVVLRPHLLRLQIELDDHHAALAIVEDALDALEATAGGRMAEVIEGYHRVAECMGDLAAELRSSRRSEEQAETLLTVARRAADAALAVAEHLRIASEQATADPDTASAALADAQALDPVNPVFDVLRKTVESLQHVMLRLQGYHPLADGSDVAGWLDGAERELRRYVDEVPDPRLPMLIGRLGDARQGWDVFRAAAVAGNHKGAVEGLQRAASAMRGLNAALAGWLKNVHSVVERARYVQRHALNSTFGRVMADGWAAWDRGSGIEAERLGRQALEEAETDAERAAADRLIRLGKVLRTWQEGHGEGDPDLTAQLDVELLAFFTPEEERYWQTFTEQMPSAEAYLSAMGPGLIQHFAETSTAAQRILFMHYVLRGVLEMYEMHPEDADFWRAAAERALPDASRHIAYLALTNVIRDRQQIVAIAEQANAVESPVELSKIHSAVESSPLHLIFRPLADAFRQIEYAFSEWEAGRFEAAGTALDAAVAKVEEEERLAHITLERFRAWIMRLHHEAVALHSAQQHILESVQNPRETPDPHLREWHGRLVEETRRLLGESYVTTVEAWRETYETMLAIYTDKNRRRSRKLRDFDEIFQRSGIEEHPAYAVYRFWRQTVEARPEFPAPPTDEPVPRYTPEGEPLGPPPPLPIADGDDKVALSLPRLRLPERRWLGVGLLVLVIIAGLIGASLFTGQEGGTGQFAVTWETFTPTLNAQEIAAATDAAVAAATARAESITDTPTVTFTPSDTPTLTPAPTETSIPTLAPGGEVLPTVVIPTAATETPLVPGATPVPTATATPTSLPPSFTFTPQTPVATPAGPLSGRQNVLLALEQYVEAYPWPETWFRPGELSGGWLLGIPESMSGDNLIRVVLPANLLQQVFGENAAARLRRIEVTLNLREYDRGLLPDGLVYFGLGLQGADESRVAVQVQLVREDAINIGARVGGDFRARTTLPINDARVELALVRYDDGTVDLLFNGEPVGSPRFLTAPNAPVMPFLFVHQGGVVVSVSDLIAELE